MKILYHHRTKGEDAQGIHITEIVNAFKKLGHSVEVVGLVEPAAEGERKSKGSTISKIASYAPPWLYEIIPWARRVSACF